MKYKFGNKIIEIEDDLGILKYFDNDFNSLSVEDGEVNCIFKLYPRQPSELNGKGEFIKVAHFLLQFYTENNKLVIEIYPNLSNRMTIGSYLPTRIQKVLSPKFNSVENKIYQSFLYHVFFNFLHLALLLDGESLFHSSAVQIEENKAILIGGYGGVGKSSTASYLCKSFNAKYLSDDLCIISKDGTVYGSPMPQHIYPYNIRDVLDGESIWDSYLDKIHWKLRSNLGKTVCRRIPIQKKFNTIQDWKNPRQIKTIIIIDRFEGLGPVTIEEDEDFKLADYMNSVMAIELSSLFNNLVTSEKARSSIYTKSWVSRRQSSIYMELSKNIKVYKYSIPKNVNITESNKQVFKNLVEELI